MRYHPIILSLMLLLASPSPHSFSEVMQGDAGALRIITHSGSEVRSLSRDDIRQIYLGNRTRFKNGEKVECVLFKDSQLYPLFLKTYVGKSVSQYTTFWKIKVFNGTGRMPQSFGRAEDVIDYVAHTPGAIGYIESDPPAGSNVSIIEVSHD